MSAYLVDSNDFAVIAQYAFKSMRPHYYNLDSRLEIEVEDAPALAVLLAQENIKSLEHRYPSEPAGGFLSHKDQTVTDFLAEVSQKARRLQGHFSPAHIKRVLGSYEYQSCEHPDYYKSDAYHVVRSLKDRLLDTLCEAYESNQREVA
jgi:hypothetical protein|tara:strand:- start:312 stop:755 length:444 start_codon:yes stop_codon:yes gene_type:complete